MLFSRKKVAVVFLGTKTSSSLGTALLINENVAGLCRRRYVVVLLVIYDVVRSCNRHCIVQLNAHDEVMFLVLAMVVNIMTMIMFSLQLFTLALRLLATPS